MQLRTSISSVGLFVFQRCVRCVLTTIIMALSNCTSSEKMRNMRVSSTRGFVSHFLSGTRTWLCTLACTEGLKLCKLTCELRGRVSVFVCGKFSANVFWLPLEMEENKPRPLHYFFEELENRHSAGNPNSRVGVDCRLRLSIF